jgi:membrane protease YdiL (CAAX protease family)
MKYSYTILSVLVVIIAFVLYVFISRLKAVENYFKETLGEERGQIRFIIYQRLTGILFFGTLPALFLIILNNSSLIESILKIQFEMVSLVLVLAFGIIICVVNYFTAGSADNLAMYPQIRVKNWTFPLLIISALSWMTYLFAYEFLFRGFFLFSCLSELGSIWAIVVNICLYAVVHIPKGKKETLGAIPLGLILCILTLQTGTIWMAFWIHCFLALSNEWFSIKYHPEMKVKIY